MSGEDSNVTIIADYFKNSTLSNSERENSKGVSLGTANHDPRGGFDLRSSRWFPGAFHLQRRSARLTTQETSGLDSSSIRRARPDRTAGAICFFDYGPFNLITPEAERTGLLLLRATRGSAMVSRSSPRSAFSTTTRLHRARQPRSTNGRSHRFRSQSGQPVPGCGRRHLIRRRSHGRCRSTQLAHLDGQPARRAWSARGFQRLELGSLGAACAQ